MKPTLYEALGLSQTAADWEIKAALRRLVRRYYAKTRAGHADVEEALRFLNHASHILGNPARRAEYDEDLQESVRTESALTTIGGPTRDDAASAASAASAALMGSDGGASITMLGLPRDKPPPSTLEPAPEWSSQLAELRRTRAGQLLGLLIVLFFFLLVWHFALPSGNAWPIVKFGVSLVFFTAGIAAIVYAIVHRLSVTIWRPPVPEGAITLVEGMIPRWRRDRTLFMGTGAPVENATWLFRLRMAELKRVSAERVSDPQPGIRLFARLFDYALWTMFVFAGLGLLAWGGALPNALDWLLTHPLVAPIWIAASWIPIEALLLTHAQTTPGRWLLCVYLQPQVSNPYAPEEQRFTFGPAIRRAADVWWRGCGGGLPVVALVAIARAREHVNRSGETRWDSQRDCLVTHGPVGNLSFVTLALGLAGALLVLSGAWKEPVDAAVERGRQSSASAIQAWQSARAPSADPAGLNAPSRVSRVDDMAGSVPAATPDAAAIEAPRGKAKTPDSPPKGPSVAPSTSASTNQPASAPAPASPSKSAIVAPNAQSAPAAPTPEATGPTSLELRDRRVANYQRQAQRQQSAGDFAGMARTCERWADEDWRNPQAYYCAGLGLQGAGRHKEAIAMFNRAGALVPRDDPLKALIADAVVRSFRAQTGG